MQSNHETLVVSVDCSEAPVAAVGTLTCWYRSRLGRRLGPRWCTSLGVSLGGASEDEHDVVLLQVQVYISGRILGWRVRDGARHCIGPGADGKRPAPLTAAAHRRAATHTSPPAPAAPHSQPPANHDHTLTLRPAEPCRVSLACPWVCSTLCGRQLCLFSRLQGDAMLLGPAQYMDLGVPGLCLCMQQQSSASKARRPHTGKGLGKLGKLLFSRGMWGRRSLSLCAR